MVDGRQAAAVDGGAKRPKAPADFSWSGVDAVVSPLENISAPQDPALAEAIALRWLERGDEEHRSIAGYAQFTLQLLALGAPPDLVEEAQQAGADEVLHAQQAYALASAFAGRALGPDATHEHNLQVEADPAQAATRAILEGCIGETVEATVAELCAIRCRDDVIRTVLLRTAADETKHAKLAWRYLAWALERNPELGPELASVFELSRPRSQASSSSNEDPAELDLEAWGLLGATAHRRVREEVWERVIHPSATALFAGVRK